MLNCIWSAVGVVCVNICICEVRSQGCVVGDCTGKMQTRSKMRGVCLNTALNCR